MRHKATANIHAHPAGPGGQSSGWAGQSGQGLRWNVLREAAKLVGIWGSASLTAFVLVMAIFTLFFGRNKVILNETIYEGYHFVGQAGKSQLSTREGYGLTSFGENGLIVNKALDPTAFRVLFIGDSFVKAKQVSDDFKFTEIVEREWNAAHPDKPIQTLNLGLGGQSIATYLSFGHNMDRHVDPDLVFLMLTGDDFMYLKRHPKMLEQVALGLATGSTAPANILTKPETADIFQRLSNDFGVRSFFGQLQLQTHDFAAQGKASSGAQPTGPDAGPRFVGRPPDTSTNTDAKDTADRSGHPDGMPGGDSEVHIQLKALQNIWGDRLVILYQASVPNMGRDAPPDYRDPNMVEMETLGIPTISLYPAYLQAFQAHKPPFGFSNSDLGKGHLNQYGHALVADQVLAFMETNDDL